jgi:hypothetical protein
MCVVAVVVVGVNCPATAPHSKHVNKVWHVVGQGTAWAAAVR